MMAMYTFSTAALGFIYDLCERNWVGLVHLMGFAASGGFARPKYSEEHPTTQLTLVMPMG